MHRVRAGRDRVILIVWQQHTLPDPLLLLTYCQPEKKPGDLAHQHFETLSGEQQVAQRHNGLFASLALYLVAEAGKFLIANVRLVAPEKRGSEGKTHEARSEGNARS